jgi:hypothetical protein
MGGGVLVNPPLGRLLPYVGQRVPRAMADGRAHQAAHGRCVGEDPLSKARHDILGHHQF